MILGEAQEQESSVLDGGNTIMEPPSVGPSIALMVGMGLKEVSGPPGGEVKRRHKASLTWPPKYQGSSPNICCLNQTRQPITKRQSSN